jgi:hypothetical protein
MTVRLIFEQSLTGPNPMVLQQYPVLVGRIFEPISIGLTVPVHWYARTPLVRRGRSTKNAVGMYMVPSKQRTLSGFVNEGRVEK